jgi:hypothetical protein
MPKGTPSIVQQSGLAATNTRIDWRESIVTPTQSAAAANLIVTISDQPLRHRSFDQLINSIARDHGHDEAVEIFERETCSDHREATMNPTLYLCGPINGCTDHEAKDWREGVKSAWAGSCIDPMKRDYRGKELESFREIVELDKIDVARCDVVLVNYDKPSVGTSMEILFAWQIGKMVVTVARSDAVISPWLRYHSHHIAPSFVDALAFIGAA